MDGKLVIYNKFYNVCAPRKMVSIFIFCVGISAHHCLVALFPQLGYLGPDDLPNVLNDHRVPLNVPGSVQPEPLYLGPGQVDVVPPLLLHLLVLRRLGLDKLLAVEPVRVVRVDRRQQGRGGRGDGRHGARRPRHGARALRVRSFDVRSSARLGSCATYDEST